MRMDHDVNKRTESSDMDVDVVQKPIKEESKEEAPASKKEAATERVDEEKEAPVAVKKEPVKDWPMRNIAEPHDHDVLYGRGGEF